MREGLLNLKARAREKDYLRFIVAGCFNTGLCFLIYSGGILLDLNYVLANSIAWVIGVCVAFLLNARFVFRKEHEAKHFPYFILANLFSLALSTGLLTLFIRGFSIDPILASILTIPLVVAVNFVTVKYLVFN